MDSRLAALLALSLACPADDPPNTAVTGPSASPQTEPAPATHAPEHPPAPNTAVTGPSRSPQTKPAPVVAPRTDPPACPPGTFADPARAELVRATATRTLAGREALLSAPDAALCFGGAARGTLQGRVVVLADTLPTAAAAARLTHQLAHLADGLDHFPAPGIPCDVHARLTPS